jgi:hypothetical protein
MKKLLTSVVMGFLLVLPALAQVTPTTITSAITNGVTLSSYVLSSNSTVTFSGVTNPPCDIWQTRGVALYGNMAAAGASTTNVTFTFSLSPDGTNWSTTLEPTISVPLNGATAVKFCTNLPSVVLEGMRQIRIKSLAANCLGGAEGFVTNVWFLRRNN